MKIVERGLNMLIITYFLIFVLLISLIIILAPYFNSFLRERRQINTSGLGREEFSEEFTPETADKSIDYTWKGSLNKTSVKGELPETYGEDNLTLLIKNPTSLYAYWDTSAKPDRGTPVLRVYEISSDEEKDELSFLFDIDIYREASNWFFSVPKDNTGYCVELGQRMPDGSFTPLLRSNPVKTPRASLSTVIDENWIPCDVYGCLSGISYGLSSGLMQKASERIDH